MDMDGTIYLGNQIFPFTLPFLKGLEAKGIGYSFLTNNPTKSPSDYLRKLSGMGSEIGEDQMLTTSRSMVDCGSIQACIEAATGRKADRVLGKPDPTMLLELEDRLGLEKDEVAMVGDRAYTDVEMARRAGALPVLVLSGETTREMLPEVSRPGDLVVADLEEFGKLLLSHE